MKKELLNELKIRDRLLKIEAVDELTKKAYQGFGSTINIIGKVSVRIRSKGWDAKEQKLFITYGAERSLLGNDMLPNLGNEVLQKQPPSYGPDSLKAPSKSPIGTDVNQKPIASDRQPGQDLDTPL